ncbi:hypothetical protein HNQ80_000179 [Anaerosolibacter carboniphilus]|uniref:Uncharacterized protein n=1 Tax=Anaerosolibacter carboniphilus TaxID=1417629 RepID=A0A841KPU0_9FIRM|nr:hypothetical protein [Anaerosolibacter carboniphilus]MBB6214110.1 hypothetical protein [Anaerosolibacter carboniphilus]
MNDIRIEKIQCPYCDSSGKYILEKNEESLLCFHCFRFINISFRNEKIEYIKSTKKHSMFNFGNSSVYKWILQYAYWKSEEGINIKKLIENIEKLNKELLNPMIDVLSKMLFEEKKLVLLNKTQGRDSLNLLEIINDTDEINKEEIIVVLAEHKKRFFDEIFLYNRLDNFHESIY